MKLSIVIPVYNEEQTVRQVIDRVCTVDLGAIEREIVVVNDGSTDRTGEMIDEAAEAAPGLVRAMHAPINLGKGAAIRIGFALVTGDVVVVQDADLELDPSEYRRLLGPIVDGTADVVYGSRFAGGAPGGVPRASRLANAALTTLTNCLFWSRLTDMETAYKMMRRGALDRLRLRRVGFDIEPELTAKLLLAGYRIHEMPIAYRPRGADAGKKMRWTDGFDAVYTLLWCRAVGRHDIRPEPRP